MEDATHDLLILLERLNCLHHDGYVLVVRRPADRLSRRTCLPVPNDARNPANRWRTSFE